MNNSIKYQLANLTFCPSTKSVEKSDGSIEKLKPQLAKILTLFIENKGELITFEELHSRIWTNRTVEDKTVQAALTKLRTSLGWQADTNLINERSEGYRLVCKVVQLNENSDAFIHKDEEIEAEKVKKVGNVKALYLTLATLIVITFISITYVYSSESDVEKVTAFTTKPITYLKGQEINPSLSPNGKLLAFTHAKNKALHYQVKVKVLSNNKFLVVDDANFSSTPSWSADGLTLYYQAFENEECMVKKAHLIDEITFGKPEVITSCGKEKSISPVAIDQHNEWLYFSYKTAINKAMQIKRINLITGKEQQLTSPTEDAYGDYGLSLSPDGSVLAILTYDAAAKGNVYTLNLKTKERTLEFSFKHLIYNVAWAKDGKSLFYIDQDAYIVQLNLDNHLTNKITKLSQPSQTIQVIKGGQFLVGFGEFYISDLFKKTLGTLKSVKLQEGYFNDHSIMPISNSPEKYTFVSNRTGLEQIWLYNDGSLKQLTNYQKQVSIKELNVSANMTSLVYLANARLNVLDLTQQNSSKAPTDDELFRSPIWHCNNETIIATTKVNDVWSLVEIKPETGTVNVLLKGVTGIKADCDNDKYYVTQEEKLGIYELTDLHGAPQSTVYLADYYLGSGKQWLVKNGIAYFVHNRAFYSANLSSNNSPDIHMTDINLKTFNLLGTTVYFSEKVLNDSYIAQISPEGSKKQ